MEINRRRGETKTKQKKTILHRSETKKKREKPIGKGEKNKSVKENTEQRGC